MILEAGVLADDRTYSVVAGGYTRQRFSCDSPRQAAKEYMAFKVPPGSQCMGVFSIRVIEVEHWKSGVVTPFTLHELDDDP